MQKRYKKKNDTNVRVYILIALILCAVIAAVSFNNNYLSGIFENTYRNEYNKTNNQDKIDELYAGLNIVEKEYIWKSSLEYGNSPKSIVLHHAASEADVDKVDSIHKEKGWDGIGYHFYIESDGTIYRGRPEEAIGAHVKGYNQNTLGISLQGNFEEKKLSEAQKDSLIKLMTYLSLKYPIGDIKGHGEIGQTLCPGKNISVDEIEKQVIENLKDK